MVFSMVTFSSFFCVVVDFLQMFVRYFTTEFYVAAKPNDKKALFLSDITGSQLIGCLFVMSPGLVIKEKTLLYKNGELTYSEKEK